MSHVPVMLDPVLRALEPRDGGLYIDCTFGAGGYSRAILEAAYPTAPSPPGVSTGVKPYTRISQDDVREIGRSWRSRRPARQPDRPHRGTG